MDYKEGYYEILRLSFGRNGILLFLMFSCIKRSEKYYKK